MYKELTPSESDEHHHTRVAESTAPSKRDPLIPRWETLAVLIWFALDQRETGELQTNSFVTWLRRVAAVPSNPAVALSDVYLMINRGFEYLSLCPLVL